MTPVATALRLDGAIPLADLDTDDEARRKQVRLVAARLPAPWKVAALRLVELALRDDLCDAILAIDPEHPQALLRAYERHGDAAVLRRVLAGAPGWARRTSRSAARRPTRARSSASPARRSRRCAGRRASTSSTPPRTRSPTPGASTTARACSSASSPSARTAAGGPRPESTRPAGRGSRGAPATRARIVRYSSCTSAPAATARGSHRRCDRCAATAVRRRRAAGTPTRSTSTCARRTRSPRSAASTTRSRCARTASTAATTRGRATRARSPTGATTRAGGARCGARRRLSRRRRAAVAGFARGEPATATDLALFLDALVAIGREDEVLLARAHLGGGSRPAPQRRSRGSPRRAR